jgi:hypothetical protein
VRKVSMKNVIFLFFTLLLGSREFACAQSLLFDSYERPQVETRDGITYFGGLPMRDIEKNAELIFEGRVLTDSVVDSVVVKYRYSFEYTYYHILVLKEFKGHFLSDTITVAYNRGRSGYVKTNMHMGEEAIFFVTSLFAPKATIRIPNVFWMVDDEKNSFIKVCDKKDVVKEVYEPIEAATGKSYVKIHPNTCATQQQK